jgi:hypothetical protein
MSTTHTHTHTGNSISLNRAFATIKTRAFATFKTRAPSGGALRFEFLGVEEEESLFFWKKAGREKKFVNFFLVGNLLCHH